MQEGFILLHRKLLENAIFYKPNYFQIWIYILLRVIHKEKEIIWNGEKKILKKGSGIFSQKKISEDLNISIGTVNNVLKYLKVENQIEINSNNKYTEIQVVKWGEYQDVESVIENRMKASRKPGESQVKHTIHVNTVNTVKTLREQVEVFLPEYGKAMIEEFLNHWEEKDENGKESWEKQKTWETKKRLRKWKLNIDTNFGRKKIIPQGQFNPSNY